VRHPDGIRVIPREHIPYIGRMPRGLYRQ
jgi:hypothetical protein